MIHSFLGAVGFRGLKRTTDLYDILEDVINYPDEQRAEQDANGNTYVECKKMFGDDFGIAVCGDYTDNNEFHMEYYYPFLFGNGITTDESIEVERHSEKEAYAGICDDMRLGVTLIFYVLNSTEVLRERNLHGRYRNGNSATLSGLASYGKVLLPIQKTEAEVKQREKSAENRIRLIAEAREGNQKAMEHLTLQDMDVYTSLSKRILKEDILSIVETSFMPFGIQSDQYSIIGEILDFSKQKNHFTQESVWILTLSCNDMVFDICINEKDLLGEPEIGRRFKGRIWMQGNVNYN
ncbi:MAG: DUF3881 family protein [Agathobacter sp.]